jgi:hypothetical protein
MRIVLTFQIYTIPIIYAGAPPNTRYTSRFALWRPLVRSYYYCVADAWWVIRRDRIRFYCLTSLYLSRGFFIPAAIMYNRVTRHLLYFFTSWNYFTFFYKLAGVRYYCLQRIYIYIRIDALLELSEPFLISSLNPLNLLVFEGWNCHA